MQLISDIIKNQYGGSVRDCQAATGTFNMQLYRWIKMGAVKSDINDNVYRQYEDGAIVVSDEQITIPVYVKIGTFNKDKS